MTSLRLAVWVLGVALVALPAGLHAEEDTLAASLRTHVEALSAEDLHGRGAWADREKAAAYVADAFKRTGLARPPGRDGYFLDDGEVDGHPRSRNVLGWLPPSPPADGDGLAEYVLVSASYDHHGVMEGRTYPGADDNATGIAALLETARTLAKRGAEDPPRRRAVLFVAFDLRERHQVGSRSFVDRPPLDLVRCLAHISLETLGRSFGGAVPGGLFAMGAEHCELFETMVDRRGSPEGGQLLRLSTLFHYEAADYHPFRDRQIPFLFIAGGPTADHDQPEDTLDKIQWNHLEARTRWVISFLRELLSTEAAPEWRAAPTDVPEDYRSLDVVLTGLQRRLTEGGATDVVRRPVDTLAERVKAFKEAGGASPADRRQLQFMIVAGIRMIPLLERAAREQRESGE